MTIPHRRFFRVLVAAYALGEDALLEMIEDRRRNGPSAGPGSGGERRD